MKFYIINDITKEVVQLKFRDDVELKAYARKHRLNLFEYRAKRVTGCKRFMKSYSAS